MKNYGITYQNKTNSYAEEPCMKDVGILASTDPIAVDQACIDIIYNSKDPGRDHFVERVERQKCRLVKEWLYCNKYSHFM